MGFDWTVFALAVPAVLFTGVSKGGFGSGAAFAAAPFLALVLSPGQAIGLMLPLLMLIDLGAIRAYWGRWSRRDALRLIGGSLPGIAAGAALYRVADPDMFRLLIGLVAIGFVAFQMARASDLLKLRAVHRPDPSRGRLAGVFWGGVTGLTSFISHAGGPPAAVYLLGRGLDKTTFQATTVLTFWAVNLAKLGPYMALGIFTRDTLIADLILAPVAFAGLWLGVHLHSRVNEKLFFRLTYAFLLVTGGKLIFDALT
ncbi:sulfite exporter TauE/SafE family protein [Mesobaculum littorinae]|uniref:sulfite exporter TauE/SafE family protein n=1 Tax=Mesobaculum littorinae TaxID=2486419 RepID=UPI001F3667F8|nr:sulfite exporter TauE/SafE family protein [Mesobaculum littorinae]